MKNSIILYLLILFYSIGLFGCIVVKHEEKDARPPTITLSPKPEIPMSDKLVRSKLGDMIAFLPENWFFVDLEDKLSPEIIAVAVNPDYTLSAVFSNIHKNDKIIDIVNKEDTIGLARICFGRHERKTASSIKLIGKYSTIQMGSNTFVKYEFSTTEGALNTRSAVFISNLKEYYEFAIVPMTYTGKPLPPATEIDKIFYSILATVQY